MLAVTNAVAQGLTPGLPIGLLTDAAFHAILVSEINARQTAWQRLEPELYNRPVSEQRKQVQVAPRPVPLPHGPIERYADCASLVALAAADTAAGVDRAAASKPAADAHWRVDPHCGLRREGDRSQVRTVPSHLAVASQVTLSTWCGR
jgi:hypothetical protein